MISWFYAYEMQVYMNVGMLNIYKSCFIVYLLYFFFFFTFGGFNVFDALYFCEDLIYTYYWMIQNNMIFILMDKIYAS